MVLVVILLMENVALAQDKLRSDERFSILPRADDQEQDRLRDAVSRSGPPRTTRPGLVAFENGGWNQGDAENLMRRIANGEFSARKVAAIKIGGVVFPSETACREEQFKLRAERGASWDKPRPIGHHIVENALSMAAAARKLW